MWESACTHAHGGFCIYVHMYAYVVSMSTGAHGPVEAASVLLPALSGHVMPGWEEGKLFASHAENWQKCDLDRNGINAHRESFLATAR